MKKWLTLDDLYSFCVTNNLANFSATEDECILVSVPATFEKSDEPDTMLFGKVKLLHTERNRNKSNVTYDAAKKCMSKIAYKPILANFTDVNGELDFTSHDMYVNDDGDIVYEEKQVGCFTADAPELVEEDGKYWLYANVAIPREYTSAAEIIERKNGTKVSCELAVYSMQYDADNKELVLEDVEVMGCTLLGTNPKTGEEVQEGMAGANLSIADFSTTRNSIAYDANDKLIETLNKLNDTLKCFDNNTTRKEEEAMQDETVVLENENTEVVENEETPILENENETETENETEVDVNADVEEEVPAEDDVVVNELTHEATFNSVTKKYSRSMNDTLMALYTLVNETYGDIDNDWYNVDCYPDEKKVVFVGWSGKAYRQSYKEKSGTYSLVGDRIDVYARYLSNDEIKALDDLKMNYDNASEKLAKYEAEPDKMDILNSDEYSQVADSEQFAALVNDHFDLSVEDVRKKADEILLDFAKTVKFEKDENANVVPCKRIAPARKGNGRYGNYFSK